jgi:hypothetical protein
MTSLNDPGTRPALTSVGVDVVGSTPEGLAGASGESTRTKRRTTAP